MWLASLRRLVAGKSRSPQVKRSRPQRRRIIPTLEHLEDRITPTTTLTVNAGDTTTLISDISQANSNSSASNPYVIDLTNSTYSFSAANNNTNGANVLPVITAADLTIVGNGATLNAASLGRLFDVASGAHLTLEKLKLTGGLASGVSSGTAGQGGALYNSGGNVSVLSATIGGNQAVGGSGQNGQGGGIYSKGGSLTLDNDVIGFKVYMHHNHAVTPATSKHSSVGASNKATGGAGGSAQGAGLYVNGGTVKLSNDFIGGNHAYGGSNGSAQGGGLYVANSSSVTLDNTLVGFRLTYQYPSGNTKTATQTTSSGSFNNAAGGASGGAAQGGGIYAYNATLTLTSSFIDTNGVTGASGAAGVMSHSGGVGGTGGAAQGGGIYAQATTLTLSGGMVKANSIQPGNGGAGAAGTAAHPTGGAGGAGGIGQGAGVYILDGPLTINNSAMIMDNQSFAGSFYSEGGSGGAGYNLNGIVGAGGAGGAGGSAAGGDVFASSNTTAPVSVTLEGGALLDVGGIKAGDGGTGGKGAPGKAGGAGGAGGTAQGGGLYVHNGNVTITGGVGINVSSLNGGYGGRGGNGGIGGVGGVGGTVEGGGVYALDTSVTLTGGTAAFSSIPNTPQITERTPGVNANNTVFAGTGGHGGSGTTGAGGNGGAGGQAQGGGVFASGSGLAISIGSADLVGSVNYNIEQGGNGGNAGKGKTSNGVGGNAGSARGGGLVVLGDTLTLTNANISANSANGGDGGNGVTAPSGVISNYGNGGDAQGGGLFVSGSSNTTVLSSTMVNDSANAGNGANGDVAAGSAKYGLGGTAQGGGLYAGGSTVNVLNSTFDEDSLLAGTQVGTSKSVGGHSTGGGTAQGGGLYAANGTLSLTNDTVAWNDLLTFTNRGSVLGQGGGVYNGPSNTLNLENNILALNLIFTNTLTGLNNTPGSTGYNANNYAYNDLAGNAATQNDDNLIGNGTDDANWVPAIGTQAAGPQQLFAAPVATNYENHLSGQLVGNYGGLTYTLPSAWNTSPAIGNGDPTAAGTIASAEGFSSANSATDQRGLPRVIDGTIDIGATETQVVLNGSPSVTTVQAGGTITYTLTVANNESTAANVSLTDLLDPNTTYQSSSGTGWTITAPSSSSGGTLTATISLAANSSATLTITVAVAANVPGNTVIANTASIAPTGNSAADVVAARSVTMDTTVPGVTVTNITNEVGLLRTPAFRNPFAGANNYVQGVLLVNHSGTTFTGPIALVLVGLPSDVTLTNASGYYNGNPYINIVPSGGSWESGWWHFLITILEFSTTNPADIKYTPEILEGI